MTYYDYEKRDGIKPISWQDFFGICKGLALAAASCEPDIILGILRAGMYPATLLSHFLRAEVYAIRVTRRYQDRVVHDTPQWIVRPPEEVRDKRVLIVDEICNEGKTLLLARDEVQNMGAKAVKSAVMYSHTWGKDIPDYIGLISDELIMNPWDREIVQDGRFIMHPEYEYALKQQNLQTDSSLLIGIEPYSLDKG